MATALSLSKGGKLEVSGKTRVTAENLAKIYTPGVAEAVKEIMKDPKKVYDLTWKHNAVAIVTDGTAILGLGDQGPKAALPVMEAKAVLFKQFGGVNAVPIVLGTKDPDEIVAIIKAIAPGFGGINLEDISAPRCFIIKEKLKDELDIPVFHDDQYGTAIVVLAGLINASKVAKKNIKKTKIVISGSGAAGVATAKLLTKYGCKNIIVYDSKGPLYRGRTKDMNFAKIRLSQKTNPSKFQGPIKSALEGADIFIGLSKANLLSAEDVSKMNKNAIVFALANPVPEILPKEAQKGGALVAASGRSDFPNQINNALVFPGIFNGVLKHRIVRITDDVKIKAALALAGIVKSPRADKIIPSVLDKRVVKAISNVFQKKKA